jgi:hypothetical protein
MEPVYNDSRLKIHFWFSFSKVWLAYKEEGSYPDVKAKRPIFALNQIGINAPTV